MKTIVTLALLLLTAPAWASEVKIGWDPNPVGEGVTTYTVYASIVSSNDPAFAGVFDVVVDTGNVTEFTVVDLPRIRGKYFFVLTASNAAGLRSDFSNEIFQDFTAEWDAWMLTQNPTTPVGAGIRGSVF